MVANFNLRHQIALGHYDTGTFVTSNQRQLCGDRPVTVDSVSRRQYLEMEYLDHVGFLAKVCLLTTSHVFAIQILVKEKDVCLQISMANTRVLDVDQYFIWPRLRNWMIMRYMHMNTLPAALPGICL